jgi:hypothetical protein
MFVIITEQKKKWLVNTYPSASLKVWRGIRGGSIQRVHAALAERADSIGGLAKRRLKSMLGLIVSGVIAGIAGLVLFEAVCEGHGCSEKLRDRYHE